MNKEFDCVKMKRNGAKILQKKITGLSIEEELKFWQNRNTEFKEGQKKLRTKKKKVLHI